MEHAKHEEFEVMLRSVDDVPAGQERHSWKLEVGLCQRGWDRLGMRGFEVVRQKEERTLQSMGHWKLLSCV